MLVFISITTFNLNKHSSIKYISAFKGLKDVKISGYSNIVFEQLFHLSKLTVPFVYPSLTFKLFLHTKF